VDGLSICMMWVSSLLFFVAIAIAWDTPKKPRLYFSLLLLLLTGLMGVFTSLDIVFFFVMWELQLIPLYLLIGMWGGEKRRYIGMKYVLYTMAGSLSLFLCIAAILFMFPVDRHPTTDLRVLAEMMPWQAYAPWVQSLLFWGFFFGLAVKLPIVPLHNWLPDVYAQGPTSIVLLLLIKTGAYALIRFNVTLFPSQFSDVAYWIALLGVINILYGAFACLAQEDFKKIVAYSSISHTGLILLGLAAMNADGINGAMFQMLSHALIAGILLVAIHFVMLQTDTSDISRLGGLALKMPLLGSCLAIGVLGTVGLPGTGGFVSELLVLVGSYRELASTGLPILAAFSIVLAAFYGLRALHQAFWGTVSIPWQGVKDISRGQLTALLPLVCMTVLIGFVPAIALDLLNPTTREMIQSLRSTSHSQGLSEQEGN